MDYGSICEIRLQVWHFAYGWGRDFVHRRRVIASLMGASCKSKSCILGGCCDCNCHPNAGRVVEQPKRLTTCTANKQTPSFPASVGPRPTRLTTIQMYVAGDVAALRCHVFLYCPAKSDASIWRTTTGAIYNRQYHRTATSAPRLSPTRFIRMASCHSDKTLFVRIGVDDAATATGN
jgi:hypothetical protein